MVALSASVGSLAVTIRGHLGRQLGCSSTSGCLIRRLSSFLLHRLPRFGLGLLWIYPPALSCQPLCLVLQAFEPSVPAVQVPLQASGPSFLLALTERLSKLFLLALLRGLIELGFWDLRI